MQTKQVRKLCMPIKHVYTLLASVNKETFFYINFSSIVTKMEKIKLTHFYVKFVKHISILVNASIYVYYDFDFIFLY